MQLLRAIWDNVYGLLVEDGSIALGTLGALVAVGLWVALAGASAGPRDLGGPLLFVLLMLLLLHSLHRAGRSAARQRQRD
jgi:hypothetical protein